MNNVKYALAKIYIVDHVINKGIIQNTRPLLGLGLGLYNKPKPNPT